MEEKNNSFLRSLRSLVLLALVIGGTYVYDTNFRKSPCEEPLQYSIGAFDLGFGITEPAFQDAIQQAADVWEKAYGKKLFAFSQSGKVAINLKYDGRQKLTQRNEVLKVDIDATRGQADSVKQEFSALQQKYRIHQTEYESAVSTFQQHQSDYNMMVSYWNERGGAPKKEFEKLTLQKDALIQEQKTLEQKRLAVNGMADKINALISTYNLLAGHINGNANEINSAAGTTFEAGLYSVDETGKRDITVYQFENKEMLVHVLIHEMGHALGLDHNKSKDSVMYAFNQNAKQIIDATDLAALQTICTKKPMQIFGMSF